MEIKKSMERKGWIGFFYYDEEGCPEEFMSVKDLKTAESIVNKLQKDIKKLKQSQTKEDN